MGLRPQRRRAIGICRTMANCVRFMWIPNSGAEVLVSPLYRLLVPAFSNVDFKMQFSGSSRITLARSASIKSIGGPPMATAEQTRYGV